MRLARFTVAGLYLLQALLLPVLHGWTEAEPHADCGACATQASPSSPAGHLDPAHNHPVHDEGDCALCRSLHNPVLSQPCAAQPWLPGLLETGLLRAEGAAPRTCRSALLPPSRAPPARLPS